MAVYSLLRLMIEEAGGGCKQPSCGGACCSDVASGEALFRIVLSPILVRPLPEGFPEHFKIVTRERSFRAAQLAGLDTRPLWFMKFGHHRIAGCQRGMM